MSKQPNPRRIDADQVGRIETMQSAHIEAMSHPVSHPNLHTDAQDEHSHVIHSTFLQMGKEAASVSACHLCNARGTCQQGRHCAHEPQKTYAGSIGWLLIVAASICACIVTIATHLTP